MEQASSSIPVKAIVGGVAAVIFLIVGETMVYNLLVKKSCSPGMQKIDNQCVDPYLKTYEKSVSQGEEILKGVDNYQNLEDLKIAQKKLAHVVNQLSFIPLDALVYSDAKAKLDKFDLEQARIYQLIKIETEVQTQMKVINILATEAKTATEGATERTQLESAKEKWQQAIAKLAEIESQIPIIPPQIELHKQDYQQQITDIDARITSLVKTPPSPSRKIVTTPVQAKPRPVNRSTSNPTPIFPVDPCAVEPQPDNCIF